MRVVGLTGSQGAGKSTLLVELQHRGWNLDNFKVSRAVQAELGWAALDQVMSSPQTMMEFQNEVFNQKLKRDFQLRDVTSITTNLGTILTERTFADILAYTVHWTWKFVDLGKLSEDEAIQFIKEYTARCVDAQLQCYSAVLMLPMMDHVVFENDPNRAKAEDAARNYEDMDIFMRTAPFISLPVLRISGKTTEERADQVEAFFEDLKFTSN